MNSDKHTFVNLVSPLSNTMHQLINLWCDFPEHRESEKFPQQMTEEEQKNFLNRVLEKSADKFNRYGYYIHNGKLNWSPDPNKYVK